MPRRKGHRLTDEHRAKISAGLKGRKVSEETKRKLSEAMKRRLADPEARRRWSEAQIARRRKEREQVTIQPDRKMCPKCREVKPVEEFYTRKKKLKSGVIAVTPEPQCKVCKRAASKTYWDKCVAELGATEAYRRKNAKEDPERRRQYKREWAAEKRRKAGIPARQFSKPRGGLEHIPTEPIAAFIEELGEERKVLSRRVGVDERELYRIENREYKHTLLATVDKILTGLDCPEKLNELYPLEEEEKLVGYHYLDPENVHKTPAP